jgi:hypothetical protein
VGKYSTPAIGSGTIRDMKEIKSRNRMLGTCVMVGLSLLVGGFRQDVKGLIKPVLNMKHFFVHKCVTSL